MVAEVEGQTAYVDPEPGLTDRLKAHMDWGGHGDDDYPVESSQILEITDDEVVIRASDARTWSGTFRPTGGSSGPMDRLPNRFLSIRPLDYSRSKRSCVITLLHVHEVMDELLLRVVGRVDLRWLEAGSSTRR